MKRKVICFIAMSLDGYIANQQGSFAFLEETTGLGDNGYTEFIANVDTVIMGNTTYQQVAELTEGAYPYAGLENYVLTRNQSNTKDQNVTFIHDQSLQFVKDLQQQPGKDIWLVGGNQVIELFQQADLVDEWIVTVAPWLLGKGIPLFGKMNQTERLELLSMKQYGEFVQLHYCKK
ncbi:dihydrofolate reductase family protein [Isobaculum melis]|uniref:Dihydrofolate reductase n=1 Tax=Isobaculum melis TaxID=142588 RepID=A0A1H9U9M0_9LACT|nr:dihydrofolate reductase family protein [Isobaculum melis]SES06032.1 Dihydrofolate reductase [Isobaculum melis]